jgi:hypothetical protein
MNREVHVRFWERQRVKVPRATRQSRRFDAQTTASGLPPIAEVPFVVNVSVPARNVSAYGGLHNDNSLSQSSKLAMLIRIEHLANPPPERR